MIAMAEVFPMNVLMSEDSQTTLHDHYRLLLGLSAPWEVSQVDLQLRENKVEVRVEWPRGKSPECPECGEACDMHDHAPERRWRHSIRCNLKPLLSAGHLGCIVPGTASKRSRCLGLNRIPASRFFLRLWSSKLSRPAVRTSRLRTCWGLATINFSAFWRG